MRHCTDCALYGRNGMLWCSGRLLEFAGDREYAALVQAAEDVALTAQRDCLAEVSMLAPLEAVPALMTLLQLVGSACADHCTFRLGLGCLFRVYVMLQLWISRWYDLVRRYYSRIDY